MSNYKKEYLELEEKMMNGEISDKEFLEKYNKLIEEESDKMMISSGFAEPHEHI